MDYILAGLKEAVHLLFSFDQETYAVIFLSLRISGTAVFLASCLGIPLGILVGLHRFPGRGVITTILNTCFSLPTVVVGLFIYLFLSHRGPLGMLGLLYTPGAMIIAQTILATPIIGALSLVAVKGVDPAITKSAISLGATRIQTTLTILKEARVAILAALIAGFGRVITEIGAAMIVGGNIKGTTRVMSTAIALETGKGSFELALALGIILLATAFLINAGLYYLQRIRE